MTGGLPPAPRTVVMPDENVQPETPADGTASQHEDRSRCNRTKLFVQATLAYRFPRPAEVLLQLEAARTQNQAVSNETLEIIPGATIARLDDSATGERRAVFTAVGDVEVRYAAAVDVLAEPLELAGVQATAVRELPSGAIKFLVPSRYCPSDRFQDFVDTRFPAYCAGDRVIAILDWLQNHIEYKPGVSDAQTDALETLVERVGVCRDFTHLAVSFCRAANVPARAVSAYAYGLNPPDMHAVTEVYLNGRWHLIDPTGRAPAETLVRVATGRDAADIAFMTVFGETELVAQTFAVTSFAGVEL